MIELDDITVNDYIELEDKTEYDFAINFANQYNELIDEYGIGDIIQLKMGIVKDIQDEMEFGTLTFEKKIDYLNLILKKENSEWIGSEKLAKFSRGLNYLYSGIEEIIKAERMVLCHEPSIEEEAAGLERFSKLGVYLQLRKLANGDITKIEAIREMPYSSCFTELYTQKLEFDFQKDLNDIYKQKNNG